MIEKLSADAYYLNFIDNEIFVRNYEVEKEKFYNELLEGFKVKNNNLTFFLNGFYTKYDIINKELFDRDVFTNVSVEKKQVFEESKIMLFRKDYYNPFICKEFKEKYLNIDKIDIENIEDMKFYIGFVNLLSLKKAKININGFLNKNFILLKEPTLLGNISKTLQPEGKFHYYNIKLHSDTYGCKKEQFKYDIKETIDERINGKLHSYNRIYNIKSKECFKYVISIIICKIFEIIFDNEIRRIIAEYEGREIVIDSSEDNIPSGTTYTDGIKIYEVFQINDPKLKNGKENNWKFKNWTNEKIRTDIWNDKFFAKLSYLLAGYKSELNFLTDENFDIKNKCFKPIEAFCVLFNTNMNLVHNNIYSTEIENSIFGKKFSLIDLNLKKEKIEFIIAHFSNLLYFSEDMGNILYEADELSFEGKTIITEVNKELDKLTTYNFICDTIYIKKILNVFYIINYFIKKKQNPNLHIKNKETVTNANKSHNLYISIINYYKENYNLTTNETTTHKEI